MINYNYSILYSSQFMSVSCLPIKLVCEYNKYIDSIYIYYHIIYVNVVVVVALVRNWYISCFTTIDI